MNDSGINRVQEFWNVVFPGEAGENKIGIERLLANYWKANVSLPNLALKIWDSMSSSKKPETLMLLLFAVLLAAAFSFVTLLSLFGFFICALIAMVVL